MLGEAVIEVADLSAKPIGIWMALTPAAGIVGTTQRFLVVAMLLLVLYGAKLPEVWMYSITTWFCDPNTIM